MLVPKFVVKLHEKFHSGDEGSLKQNDFFFINYLRVGSIGSVSFGEALVSGSLRRSRTSSFL